MIKHLLIALLLATLCHAHTINIAVATNVSYVMNDLILAFKEDHPLITINVSFGSSGKLSAQIQHGAPYGLFLAADMIYAKDLFEKKIALALPQVYAQGSLVCLSHKKRDLSEGMDLLKDSNIKRIAIANPQTAPYGKATLEAIKQAISYKSIEKKLIYAESIAQVLSYTLTATDLGFIAKSSLYAPKMKHFKQGEQWFSVNPKLYTPIKQGMVLLRYGINDPAFKDFYTFILSKKAQNIFNTYGYTTL